MTAPRKACGGLAIFGVVGALVACGGSTTTKESTMKLTSPAFTHEGAIPKKYTCEGDDVSPPLVVTGVPAEAKSLALIVDDPDAPDPKAPKRTWVHWVAYNLSPTTKEIPEGTATPPGSQEGVNDWSRPGYGGPCPPIGRHRYYFKLYALDTTLPGGKRYAKSELEAAMRGHVIAETVLLGTYQKGN